MLLPAPMFPYAITLTCSKGFDPADLTQLKKYFKQVTDSTLLVSEEHASGHVHVHAATMQKQKTTNEVTRLFERFYANVLDIVPTIGVSIVVKKVSDKIGWFHYLLKDQQGPPLMCHGWKLTWIQEQCISNLKKIPKRILLKDVHALDNRVAVPTILEYAKRTNNPLTGKTAFASVVAEMMAKGYAFHKCRLKMLYVHVMAHTGDMRPAMSFIMGELTFID